MKRLSQTLILAGLVIAFPATSLAASYEFEWVGSNGYRMEGAISISNDLSDAVRVTHHDIQCFWIKGYQDDRPIGQWSLGDLTKETSWHVNFSPRFLRFPTGGNSPGPRGQEWNMNGRGNNCGIGGFGFNVGTAAQDFCVNNRLIYPSQIAYDTPFPVTRNDAIQFEPEHCGIQAMS